MSTKTITPIPWIILIGYLFFAAATVYVLGAYQWARDLFDSTTYLIKINAVWFALLIVFYGAYALIRNYQRIRLSNLRVSLDAQFLLVIAFFLFASKEVLILVADYIASNVIEHDSLHNGAVVLNFGGYVAGVASIYMSRKQRRN